MSSIFSLSAGWPCILLILLLIATDAGAGQDIASNSTACVVASKLDDGSYDFSLEADASLFYASQYNFLIPAAVWFNTSIEELGMAFQTVKTSGDIDDYLQAYWAGFLELYISRDMTTAHFENTWSGKQIGKYLAVFGT